MFTTRMYCNSTCFNVHVTYMLQIGLGMISAISW